VGIEEVEQGEEEANSATSSTILTCRGADLDRLFKLDEEDVLDEALIAGRGGRARY
jgi:hypothetical protein